MRKKTKNKILKILLLSGLTLICLLMVYLFNPWWPSFEVVVPHDDRVENIEVPVRCKRIPSKDGFATFVRSLPLQNQDSIVHTWDKKIADTIQPYCYRIVDFPIIDMAEQCADVCMHIRAEYLFQQRRFFSIHFEDTQYNTMWYLRGGYRPWFYAHLYKLFGYANTESLKHELPRRDLEDVEVGDLFVYDAKSRENAKYGHAMMVADVAVDTLSGQKYILLLQGSTPACDIHILCNKKNPVLSPWFPLLPQADTLDFGFARYHKSELLYFKD